MTLDINSLEAVWLVLNGTTALVSLVLLIDHFLTWRVVQKHNGKVREDQVRVNVVTALIRLSIQVLLFSLGVLAAFAPGPPRISVGVVILMAVALLLLLNSLIHWAGALWIRRTAAATVAQAAAMEAAGRAKEDDQDG